MKYKKIAALAALVLAGSLALSGCGNAKSEGTRESKAPQSSESGTSDKKPGFEEIPIPPEDQTKGPLTIGTVFFQPIDMQPANMGLKAADASLHLEADIHAAADNKLGYAKGEFVPDLTVKYTIENKNDPSDKQEGTFMQMNASDGPHYGANIKMDKAGSYKLTYSIESPERKGWMLHVDPETGVDGRFWTEPIVVSWDWDYTPHEW
ncbi:amino acid ABC transporter substrate-binding protein [Bifidobacterium aemilianum]|uniref:Amino acid ABC transporter substrate-binding protein n=1 Tax=Bifidobacterium aemilianum TaxID=2493120 RepID=A0A366K645_9BIFI|nr:iron transporter [Bifidobacterium aemilianum]RBP97210.1 amino acid ABC transporter substrate-binding protein [Bifidobacterium aemilianum]